MKETKTIEAIQAEQEELRILLDEGVHFEIKINKKNGSQTELFLIKEPTLSTMDRMSKYFLQIEVDENNLSNDRDVIYEALNLIPKNAKRLAKIIAIAVVGDNYYYISKGIFSKYRYKSNEKRVRYLSRLFYETIKPSDLVHITQIIISMCNLGNFVSSMRLMSASRTTAPRIEKKV